MDGPNKTVNPAYVQSHRAQASDLEKRPDEFKTYHETLQPENLSAHTIVIGQLEKSMQKYNCFVETNSKLYDIVISTSVQSQGTGLGWKVAVKQGERIVHYNSGACSHDFQSDHGGGSDHTRNAVASLKT